MALSLEDKMEEIKRRRIDLGANGEPMDAEPHRPEITMWAEKEIGDPPRVAVSIGALFGQQARFVDLSPDEARILAGHLTALANAVDAVVDSHEPPDPPGFEGGFAANH